MTFTIDALLGPATSRSSGFAHPIVCGAGGCCAVRGCGQLAINVRIRYGGQVEIHYCPRHKRQADALFSDSKVTLDPHWRDRSRNGKH